MRRRIVAVHATGLVAGFALLTWKAAPVYYDGGLALTGGVLWWLVPPAALLGGVGGAVEGFTLRRSPGHAGWVVAAVAGLLGLAVPAWFVDTFAWVPADQQAVPSTALFTAWFGWALFVSILTAAAAATNHPSRRSGSATDQQARVT